MKRINLTAEQLATARHRYRKLSRQHGAASIARELGVSADALLRHIDPEYCARRNRQARENQTRNYKPTGYRYGSRRPVTLVTIKSLEESQ